MSIHIYVDESGDLGMRGSKYFVIAALKTKDPKSLERIIKRVRQRKLKKPLKKAPEIKANKSPPHIRKYILEKISKQEVKINAIVVEKSMILPRLYEVKNRLYNYLAGILLKEFNKDNEMIIIIDKKDTNALIRKDFDEYIARKLEIINNKRNIKIFHKESQTCKGLQVVDFVAWAIFRKYEKDDEEYFEIIKNKTSVKYLWKR